MNWCWTGCCLGGLTGLSGASPVLARCRYGAGQLLDVGVLMLTERGDGDVPDTIDFVADDLLRVRQLGQQRVNVAFIPGKNLDLKFLRAIL